MGLKESHDQTVLFPHALICSKLKSSTLTLIATAGHQIYFTWMLSNADRDINVRAHLARVLLKRFKLCIVNINNVRSTLMQRLNKKRRRRISTSYFWGVPKLPRWQKLFEVFKLKKKMKKKKNLFSLSLPPGSNMRQSSARVPFITLPHDLMNGKKPRHIFGLLAFWQKWLSRFYIFHTVYL